MLPREEALRAFPLLLGSPSSTPPYTWVVQSPAESGLEGGVCILSNSCWGQIDLILFSRDVKHCGQVSPGGLLEAGTQKESLKATREEVRQGDRAGGRMFA